MNKKEFFSLTLNDFALYYKETFLKISKDFGKTWEYTYIDDYIETKNLEDRKIIVHEGNKKVTYKISNLEFDFNFPVSGLYQLGKDTYYYSRRTERQNKKGICYKTIQVNSFLSFFPTLKQLGFVLSSKNLNSLFLPEQKENSLAKAKEKIGKKRVLFIPLNRNFGISCGIWTKLPTLWYRFVPIGEINKKKIQLSSEMFLQEVKDSFEKDGYNVVKA